MEGEIAGDELVGGKKRPELSCFYHRGTLVRRRIKVPSEKWER